MKAISTTNNSGAHDGTSFYPLRKYVRGSKSRWWKLGSIIPLPPHRGMIRCKLQKIVLNISLGTIFVWLLESLEILESPESLDDLENLEKTTYFTCALAHVEKK